MAGFAILMSPTTKFLKSRFFFRNLPFYVVVPVRVLRTATGTHQSNFWNGLKRGTGLMSLRDVRSQGLGRITAIIAAMMIALATMFLSRQCRSRRCRRRLPDEFRFLDRGRGQH